MLNTNLLSVYKGPLIHKISDLWCNLLVIRLHVVIDVPVKHS